MSNKELAKIFRLTGQLLELHDENPFKIKSYTNAAFKVEKAPEQLSALSLEELEKTDGIGKSLAQKLRDIVETKTFADLDAILAKTPVGVVEMLAIKGIGPKKVASLWHELGIESVGELLYACYENRLVELKGFGAKTQMLVQQGIEFMQSNAGKLRYATAEKLALVLEKLLDENPHCTNVSFTGALRRRLEIVDKIELLVACSNIDGLKETLNAQDYLLADTLQINNEKLSIKTALGISVEIVLATDKDFNKTLFLTTSSPEHLKQLGEFSIQDNTTEDDIYKSLELQYIEPELREGLNEVALARENKIPVLLELTDLKGILHNHSTYSDGTHTLAQMAEYCKELGYEYLGICDHSQTAVYANGLKPERVLQQHAEIDLLNAKLAPFKVFKGIESDILGDGSLDYEESMLKTFDFVVASVHSNLKMDEERATTRLIKAIENPYTTILGHPTGRLLLARPGYPIDHKKVIDACAANKVVIELNANPYRLDIDWHWIQYALERNVMISINPDAHSKEGYHDMYYGVCVARKGMLTKDMTFNALSRVQIEAYFKNRTS